MSAQVYAHPELTGAQIDVICRRHALCLARASRDRYLLVQTSGRPEPMLQIARVLPIMPGLDAHQHRSLARQILEAIKPRDRGPEAA